MESKNSTGQKKPQNPGKKGGKGGGKTSKGPSGIAKRAAEAREAAEWNSDCAFEADGEDGMPNWWENF